MKIAVSACLLGQNCKYSGGSNLCPELVEYLKGHEVIPVCPEVAGGLSVPRSPVELVDGHAVNRDGEDVTEAFRTGVEKECARAADAELAILQPRSPSCGTHSIYDGSFSGRLIPGWGMFAGALMAQGVRVAEPAEVLTKKRPRLISLDMDGTLLNSKKKMPPDFMDWVKAHPDIRIVAASGRQLATLQEMFPGLEDSLVYMSDNGALVMYRGEVLYSNIMEKADILRSIALIRGIPGALPVVCGIRSAYISTEDADALREAGFYYARLEQVEDIEKILETDNVVKVAVYFAHKDAGERVHDLEALGGNIAPVLSGVFWCDIANADVSKGNALKMLMERLNIAPEDCMAFGDYLNDADMLRAVGESYAMANALPELKRQAKHFTGSNDRCGVMQILREIE